jgi:hypothetical protein
MGGVFRELGVRLAVESFKLETQSLLADTHGYQIYTYIHAHRQTAHEGIIISLSIKNNNNLLEVTGSSTNRICLLAYTQFYRHACINAYKPCTRRYILC